MVAGATMCVSSQCNGQGFRDLRILELDSGVTLSFDEPKNLSKSRKTEVIIFALPNGNTTAQTYGKILKEGEDWHFDIQHIGAQTAFIRNTDPQKNYIVVYAENSLKSWPAWRRKIAGADDRIGALVTLINEKYNDYDPGITLACHSGGGSFIFGYLNAFPKVPLSIGRIAFLDATYGYETEKHKIKLSDWLKTRHNKLEVISYNDSVVVYNGKPLVSPTGGTWYRSQLMAKDLGMKKKELGDRILFRSGQNAEGILIRNPEGKIFHTVLVEKNGFIHAIFANTKFENKGYSFWGERAYTSFISN